MSFVKSENKIFLIFSTEIKHPKNREKSEILTKNHALKNE